jgi:hypothetical protein
VSGQEWLKCSGRSLLLRPYEVPRGKTCGGSRDAGDPGRGSKFRILGNFLARQPNFRSKMLLFRPQDDANTPRMSLFFCVSTPIYKAGYKPNEAGCYAVCL